MWNKIIEKEIEINKANIIEEYTKRIISSALMDEAYPSS
jgi:hypothetical protein